MQPRRILIVTLALVATALVAQTQPPASLVTALESFQAGEFATAIESLNAGIQEDGSEPWLGHYQFWQARTLMAANLFTDASNSFDVFLAAFTDHPYREEAEYQRARLFFLTEEYDAAIGQFGTFMQGYPDSSFYPNALYWTGESLFSLGNVNEAERFFAEVTERFPTSFRVEAARYRLDVIDLARRENELLTLLQWSHEEYLSALESFQQREVAYQEALSSYRERLASLATDDFEDEILALNSQIDDLEDELLEKDVTIFELMARIRQLEATASATPSTAPGTTSVVTEAQPVPEISMDASDEELRASLDTLRAEAQELQRILLEELGGGQ